MPSSRNKVKEFHQILKSLNKKTHGQAKIYDYNPDNIDSFIVEIQPKKGLYQGGKFLFQINLGPYYPREPPDVICLTDIYHPNIDTDNFESHNICLNLFDEWNRSFGLEDVIQGIIFLFYYPNLRDPISHLFNLSLTQEEYEQNVMKSLNGGSIDGYPFQRNPGIDAPETGGASQICDTDENPEGDSNDACAINDNSTDSITQIEKPITTDDNNIVPVAANLEDFTNELFNRLDHCSSPTLESKVAVVTEASDIANSAAIKEDNSTEDKLLRAGIVFNDIEMSLTEDYNESGFVPAEAKYPSEVSILHTNYLNVSNSDQMDLPKESGGDQKEENFDSASEDGEFEDEDLKPCRPNELCHKSLIGRYSCSCSSDTSFSSDSEDSDSHFTAETNEDCFEDAKSHEDMDVNISIIVNEENVNYMLSHEFPSTFAFPPLHLTLSNFSFSSSSRTIERGTFFVSDKIFSLTKPFLLYPNTESEELGGTCLSWRLHPQLYCLISAYKCLNTLIKYAFVTSSNNSEPLSYNSRQHLFMPPFSVFLFGGVIRFYIGRYLKSISNLETDFNLVLVPETKSNEKTLQALKN